jgi:signal transduction histidine kinase
LISSANSFDILYTLEKKIYSLNLFTAENRTRILSRRNIAILIIIAVSAAVVSLFSNQYYTATSAKIADVASHEIRTNAQIQVHDLSQILANKLESIGSLLQTLADSPAIHNNEHKRADIVINTRQNSSSQITDFYMWLDKNGKMNWLSNINQSGYQRYKGVDLSYRPYFLVPRQTHAPYYSSLIESNDKVPRLYISYPVINMTGKRPGAFTGVVVASIRADNLGNVLKSQLFPQFNSTLGLLDKNGIVLYSNTRSYIGKEIFGYDIQSTFKSLLSPQSEVVLNNLLKSSLQGNSGSGDISAQGAMSTIAYEPVKLSGNYFLTSYIVAPHNLASDVGGLINQQKNVSTFIVIIIGAVAFGVAFLVLLWNKGLESKVNARTVELKAANEQLKVHDKMQKEFINIASHEMKTPTQAILGYSDLLESHPDKRQEMIQAISRNAVRLQRLTSDILDVTRIESQSLRLNKEVFSLDDIVTSIVQDYRTQIEKENRALNIFYNHGFNRNSIIVEADRERITQVISNLLNNALKFTRTGTITISAIGKVSEAIVCIRDTGAGIRPEILPRLFTKFTTNSDTGTGLGLFISKSIIESHGGKMTAQNNNINGGLEKGAMFCFSLPITKKNT